MSLKSYIAKGVLGWTSIKFTERFQAPALHWASEEDAKNFVWRKSDRHGDIAFENFSNSNLLKIAEKSKHFSVVKEALRYLKVTAENKGKVTNILLDRGSLELFATLMRHNINGASEMFLIDEQKDLFEKIGRKSSRLGTPEQISSVLDDHSLWLCVKNIQTKYPDYLKRETMDNALLTYERVSARRMVNSAICSQLGPVYGQKSRKGR